MSLSSVRLSITSQIFRGGVTAGRRSSSILPKTQQFAKFAPQAALIKQNFFSISAAACQKGTTETGQSGSSTTTKLDFDTVMLPATQTLPVFVPPSRFMRLKEFMGYQGGLAYPQPVLSVSALNLYLCIQYQIDFDKFFKKLNYPDVFYSYCLVNFLHVWIMSVPLIHYGRSGIHVRKLLHQNMWKDIEVRSKKLNSSMNRENKLKAYNHLNDIFKAFLFGFDEGILSDDTVLAGAVWRHLFQQKEIEDYSVVVEMCDYIRKNVSHLDTITEVDLIKNGCVSFVDFEQTNLDHSKVRVKLVEKLTFKMKRDDQ